MGHDHGHAHAVADADRRWLSVALAITVALVGVEVAVGLLSGSIAVLSDAGHNVTDALSIGLALLAAGLAARPARGAMTYGLRRSEILSAQVNGVTLLALAAVLAYESVRRLIDPPDVAAVAVIAVGVGGGLANAAAAWALSRAERRSLNVEGATKHVLADLYGSVAAVIGGVAVLAFDFGRADPIAAVVVVLLMLHAGWGLLRDSTRVLLEAAPRGIDPQEVGRAMAGAGGVSEVHDLHVWEVTSGFPALSAHVLVRRDDDCHARRRQLERLLRERFGIEHTTLQVDHEPDGGLLEIEVPGGRSDPSAPPEPTVTFSE